MNDDDVTPEDRAAISRALGLLVAVNEHLPEADSGEFVWLMMGEDSQERYDTIIAMAEICIGLVSSIDDPAEIFSGLAMLNAEKRL